MTDVADDIPFPDIVQILLTVDTLVKSISRWLMIIIVTVKVIELVSAKNREYETK